MVFNGQRVCDWCGALVVDIDKHTEFHKELMNVKDFMDQRQRKM